MNPRAPAGSQATGQSPIRTRPVASLRVHPAAARVPAMSEAEFTAFCHDIAAHGIQQPLAITRDGQVLDGRHRLRAAKKLALARVPVIVAIAADPLDYVLRCAMQRRHLSASQKAALALELYLLESERDHADQRRRGNLKHHAAEVATLPPRGARTRELAAKVAGVSARTMQDVITVHNADRDLFEQIKAGNIPAHLARRQVERRRRHAHIGTAPAMPTQPFQLLYADPPWQLGNPSAPYAPEQYYPTMTVDEICALTLPAAADAVLYLWAVNSLLAEALHVIDAWGFTFKGTDVWIKDSIGLGQWTRSQHELLLIGRRGKLPPPPARKRLPSVFHAPRAGHSEKPAVVYERLEHLYPHLSKLELFARGTPRPGWTAWGNQLDDAEAA